MRCVVQRVNRASVTVEGELISEIGVGYLALLGVEDGDNETDADYIAAKLTGLRVFEDENDKMNLSVTDVSGGILLVSQFTLLGDARHGRRPSFSNAAKPDIAEALCSYVADKLIAAGVPTVTGKFRAHMKVQLENDGPVTILLDSRKGF